VTSDVLTPMLALASWTLFMWVWMYATRIPAMKTAGIDPQDAAHPGALNSLPAKARQVADNYNHLHEQPTIFYALMVYSHLAGTADVLMAQLAWGYVGIRVLHSLVQATINRVLVRFLLFATGSIMLVIVAARNILVA